MSIEVIQELVQGIVFSLFTLHNGRFGLGIISRFDLLLRKILTAIGVKFLESGLDNRLSSRIHFSDDPLNKLLVVDLAIAILIKKSENSGLGWSIKIDSVIFESIDKLTET